MIVGACCGASLSKHIHRSPAVCPSRSFARHPRWRASAAGSWRNGRFIEEAIRRHATPGNRPLVRTIASSEAIFDDRIGLCLARLAGNDSSHPAGFLVPLTTPCSLHWQKAIARLVPSRPPRGTKSDDFSRCSLLGPGERGTVDTLRWIGITSCGRHYYYSTYLWSTRSGPGLWC